MSDQIFWYLTRSAALVSWLAAAGAIIVGAMIPSRLLGRRPTIPWLTDLHRMLGALASVFLLIHMATLWLDHFVAFRLADLLIPFAAEVPGLSRTSLALGVVAAWLTAVVEVTSLDRERLPEKLWRSVHLTSYAIFVLGSIHAILAGSDVTNPIIASLGTSVLTAVALTTAVRIRRMRHARHLADAAYDASTDADADTDADTWATRPETVSSSRAGTRPPDGPRPPGGWGGG